MQNADANTKTWTQEVSIIHVLLQNIAALQIFGKKVKPIALMMYDKYFIIAGYRCSSALRPVIAMKIGGNILVRE